MEMVLGDGGGGSLGVGGGGLGVGGDGLGVGGGGLRSPGGGFRNLRVDKTDSFNGCGRAGSVNYHGAALDIDVISSKRSRQLLARVYSLTEVSYAIEYASLHTTNGNRFRRRAQHEVDEMWGVFLVLTSDAAWGASRVSRLGEAVKSSARVFMHALLQSTCDSRELSDHYTVVNFMVHYVHRMQHPAFARLLRGVILAFPQSIERVSRVRDANQEYLTALLMAADDERVPEGVVKVLLEGGACVDHVSDNGDTPLMLACYTSGETLGQGKAGTLLDYGARIDVYNMQLQTALHLAAESENHSALEVLLRVRARACETSTAAAAFHPDPVHMPDLFHKTPLTTVCLNPNIHYSDRTAMAGLLVDAGADGDEDISQQTRRAAEACNAPLAYGIMTFHPLELNTVYASMRKAGHCFDMEVALELLVLFVDKEASVLPGPESPMFSVEWVFMSCKQQRFCCRPDLGGLDFDVHFDLAGEGGGPLDFRADPSDRQAQFTVCVRMPKGPCPLSAWTDEFWMEDPAYLEANIYPDYGFTLAHHAVVCPDADTRMRVVHLAEGLCNPLKRCSEGYTAAETLADLASQYAARPPTLPTARRRVVPWPLARLLKRMRKRERSMRQYILGDAWLLADGAVGVASQEVQQRDRKKRAAPSGPAAAAASSKKPRKRGRVPGDGESAAATAVSQPPFVSRFASLPDDVCGLLLRFV